VHIIRRAGLIAAVSSYSLYGGCQKLIERLTQEELLFNGWIF
jgi:hypothetical protein